jgi:hypothetical protein
MRTEAIGLTEETSRWRFRWPRGHTRWTSCADHVYCKECAAQDDSGTFQRLWNHRTDERLSRAAVTIVDAAARSPEGRVP